jgi:allophanate hydrolase subunit 2
MSHALAAGETLTMPGSPDDQTAAAGARAYLAVPGGLDVPVVLGSRSTCLAAGFGGIDGRPLRQGDRLVASGIGAPTLAGRAWLEDRDAAGLDRPIRLLPGPGLGVGPTALDALCKVTWTVGLASNRQGLRLTGDGTVMSSLLPDAGTQLSHGVVPGTIQLPPDGGAIVLLADAQPTGGYPVVGVVISADLPIMGQLAPGASVRFERVTPAEAVVAWTVRQAALAAGAGRLHGVPGWDDLGRSAGG